MFCSVLFRKTSVSMMTVYVILLTLFGMPVVVEFLFNLLAPGSSGGEWAQRMAFFSPFATAFQLPLLAGGDAEVPSAITRIAAWGPTAGLFLAFYLTLDATLLGIILWLFNSRWRVVR